MRMRRAARNVLHTRASRRRSSRARDDQTASIKVRDFYRIEHMKVDTAAIRKHYDEFGEYALDYWEIEELLRVYDIHKARLDRTRRTGTIVHYIVDGKIKCSTYSNYGKFSETTEKKSEVNCKRCKRLMEK